MSHAVTPFAVSLAQVRKIVGSRSKSLLLELREAFEEEILEDRERVEEANQNDEFDPELRLDKALRHLIMDEERWYYEGAKYGRAVELLCTHYGNVLSNDRWSNVSLGWIETLDDAVIDAGASADTFSIVGHLFHRGCPIDIPDIEDFPYIGYVKLDEIPEIQAVLTDELIASIEHEEAEDIRHSIEQIREWLAACQSEKSDLVCFYY